MLELQGKDAFLILILQVRKQLRKFKWRLPAKLVRECVCELSRVWLFETPRTIAHRAPLSMGFSRQEYWSRLPFPTPGNLSYLGIEPGSLGSPALAGRFFTTSTTIMLCYINNFIHFNLPPPRTVNYVGICSVAVYIFNLSDTVRLLYIVPSVVLCIWLNLRRYFFH